MPLLPSASQRRRSGAQGSRQTTQPPTLTHPPHPSHPTYPTPHACTHTASIHLRRPRTCFCHHFDSFIDHTASANGGVMSATGGGGTSVQLEDVAVQNSSAYKGAGFEIINTFLDCVRCALTGLQARADAATTHPLLHHHHSPSTLPSLFTDDVEQHRGCGSRIQLRQREQSDYR